MTFMELSLLTDRLTEAHERLKIGEVTDVSLSKNDFLTLLRALDLLGGVKRVLLD